MTFRGTLCEPQKYVQKSQGVKSGMGGMIYQLFKKQVAFQLLFVIFPQPPFGVGHSSSLAARPLGLDAPPQPHQARRPAVERADPELPPARSGAKLTVP